MVRSVCGRAFDLLDFFGVGGGEVLLAHELVQGGTFIFGHEGVPYLLSRLGLPNHSLLFDVGVGNIHVRAGLKIIEIHVVLSLIRMVRLPQTRITITYLQTV